MRPGASGAGRRGDEFLGLVRAENLGRAVTFLDYEAYEPLAVKAFGRIADEIAERWPGATIGVHHRVGRVDIAQASIAIVAVSAHRADAFAACRYVIERVKQIAPIWKHEHFEGGDVWIEGATADPDDERRGWKRGNARARDGAALRAAQGDRRRAGTRARRPGAMRRWPTCGRARARLSGDGAVPRIGVRRAQRRVRAHGRRRRRWRRDRVPAAGVGGMSAGSDLNAGAEATAEHR